MEWRDPSVIILKYYKPLDGQNGSSLSVLIICLFAFVVYIFMYQKQSRIG